MSDEALNARCSVCGHAFRDHATRLDRKPGERGARLLMDCPDFPADES